MLPEPMWDMSWRASKPFLIATPTDVPILTRQLTLYSNIQTEFITPTDFLFLTQQISTFISNFPLHTQRRVGVRHGYPWVPTDQAHGRPRQVGPAY
jgi:hypothetical protein